MELPKIQRILAPTDFSPFSSRALDCAVALARLYHAEIEILHVFPLVVPIFGDLTYSTPIVRLDENTRKALSEHLDRFAQPAKDSGLSLTTLVLEGDPSSVILRRAETSPADLVVMGTHGTRGLDRWLTGSVVQRVLRKAPCPVLSVTLGSDGTPSAGPYSLKRILCALDLSEHSESTLQYALSLARASNAGLAVIHVMDGESTHEEPADVPAGLPFIHEFRHHVESRARGILESLVPGQIEDVFGIEKILVRGRAYEVILRTASERQSDLIVMGVHGRKGIGLPFFGSTALHVVQQAQCPVLTIRPR